MREGVPASAAEEQASLRRVATLVARRAPPDEVFATVTREVARLLGVRFAHLGRYELDDTVTFVAVFDGAGALPVGTRLPLGGRNVCTEVARTGRPARSDGYADASGPIALAARERGVRHSIGAPIVVEGRLWGVMVIGSGDGQPPLLDVEASLGDFTELLATAIANVESRGALAKLAEEQAALRRVATLVAHGAPPAEVFTAVTSEVSQLFRIQCVHLGRYEPHGAVMFVAASGGSDAVPIGTHMRLGGDDVTTMVSRTGRSARIDLAVATPVVVEDRLWGVMVVRPNAEESLPADADTRLAKFTELLATAIANAEGRAQLSQLVQEQAALRRIATLVARGEEPERVFAAATREVAMLFSVVYAGLGRYGPNRTVTHLAAASRTAVNGRLGLTRPLGGKNLNTIVYDTSRPVRLDTYSDVSGPYSSVVHEYGITSSAGAPIIVEGRLWGVMGIYATLDQPIAAGTETRLASFTELLATAIANAESRAELDASRVRIVTAGDVMRRRIERDLHDGAQQQLVSLILELKKAQAASPCEECGLRHHVAQTGQALTDVLQGLQEISRGIHSVILSKGGLGPALKTLSRRSAVPVELDVRAEKRLPEYIEVAAYYVASEALANAAKHASASVVTIELDAQAPLLRLEIRDDGVGGADASRGSGLVGLADRIEALGGRFELSSPTGQGTTMVITVPVE
jgi:signal transduction histidine kinase